VVGNDRRALVATLTPRELAEFRTLRDTIRERGTTRVWVVLIGFSIWGGLVLATAATMPIPVATVLPLLILATAFEIVFALHTGVERVGRYIQVFFEDGFGWEHAAMKLPASGIDPLFANHFRIGAILNFVPAAFARPVPAEWVFVAAIHVLFILRVALARRRASRQRAIDLEHFEQLKNTRQAAFNP
jgi:hypothetical protein